jgi:hypothetical protein
MLAEMRLDVPVDKDLVAARRLGPSPRQVLSLKAFDQIGHGRGFAQGLNACQRVTTSINQMPQPLGLVARSRCHPIWISANDDAALSPCGPDPVIEDEAPRARARDGNPEATCGGVIVDLVALCWQWQLFDDGIGQMLAHFFSNSVATPHH